MSGYLDALVTRLGPAAGVAPLVRPADTPDLALGAWADGDPEVDLHRPATPPSHGPPARGDDAGATGRSVRRGDLAPGPAAPAAPPPTAPGAPPAPRARPAPPADSRRRSRPSAAAGAAADGGRPPAPPVRPVTPAERPVAPAGPPRVERVERIERHTREVVRERVVERRVERPAPPPVTPLVRRAPLGPAPGGRSERSAPAAEPAAPTVHVRIGRVVVGTGEPARPAPARPTPPPVQHRSLADYLDARDRP